MLKQTYQRRRRRKRVKELECQQITESVQLKKMERYVRIITARKRSLGQGNIFTPVCHSVHGGGLPQCMPGNHPPDQAHPPGSGPPDQAPPPPQTRHPQSMLGDTVNARAVRILLECKLIS